MLCLSVSHGCHSPPQQLGVCFKVDVSERKQLELDEVRRNRSMEEMKAEADSLRPLFH